MRAPPLNDLMKRFNERVRQFFRHFTELQCSLAPSVAIPNYQSLHADTHILLLKITSRKIKVVMSKSWCPIRSRPTHLLPLRGRVQREIDLGIDRALHRQLRRQSRGSWEPDSGSRETGSGRSHVFVEPQCQDSCTLPSSTSKRLPFLFPPLMLLHKPVYHPSRGNLSTMPADLTPWRQADNLVRNLVQVLRKEPESEGQLILAQHHNGGWVPLNAVAQTRPIVQWAAKHLPQVSPTSEDFLPQLRSRLREEGPSNAGIHSYNLPPPRPPHLPPCHWTQFIGARSLSSLPTNIMMGGLRESLEYSGGEPHSPHTVPTDQKNC